MLVEEWKAEQCSSSLAQYRYAGHFDGSTIVPHPVRWLQSKVRDEAYDRHRDNHAESDDTGDSPYDASAVYLKLGIDGFTVHSSRFASRGTSLSFYIDFFSNGVTFVCRQHILVLNLFAFSGICFCAAHIAGVYLALGNMSTRDSYLPSSITPLCYYSKKASTAAVIQCFVADLNEHKTMKVRPVGGCQASLTCG